MSNKIMELADAYAVWDYVGNGMANRAALEAEIDRVVAENERLCEALLSFTKSDYIKKQHPKRYAAAHSALGEKS